MACPVCGKPSPCAHEQTRTAVLIDPEIYDDSEPGFAQALQPSFRRTPAVSTTSVVNAAEQPWRQEVISRVQQHRARRRKRFDPNATMDLDFAAELERLPSPEQYVALPPPVVRMEPPKIIEFPRPLAMQSASLLKPEELELAEPVLETPRILDAPEPEAEQMDLLPAFADIQLQAEEIRVPNDVELPPQPAPLHQRIFAGLVDATIVLVASVAFAATFVAFANGMPKPKSSLLCGLMAGGILWLVYQYLFLVYSPATLGMRMAGLELCTFKGEQVSL